MYRKLSPTVVVVFTLLSGGMIRAAGLDVTAPGDVIQGVPNDGVTDGSRNFGWPGHERPALAIDDNTSTKYLHFKGEFQSTGFRVTPSASRTVVVGLTFTTANDAEERDPVAFEFYGSDVGIDGPYTLIAGGDIVDFSQATPWPRFTMNETPVFFDNDVPYDHYQVLLTAVRNPGSANSMQISEVELLRKGSIAANPDPADSDVHLDTWASLSWAPGSTADSHDVYFGESFAAVNDGTGGAFRGNQRATGFFVGLPGFPYPDGLVPGTTYYWRIDEVEADGVIRHRGRVWSFYVSGKAYNPIPPDDAVFVATDVALTWVAGFDAREHTVHFGDDLDAVANAVGAIPQALTRYDPGALEFDKTYYWRVDEFDGNTTHKGDLWSFTTQPDYATAATVVVIPKNGDWASSINALRPGDIGQLEAGRYPGGKTITVSGTPHKPIIIRGAGRLESVFDGESGIRALGLENCSNLIVENITVTNPSPIGIDGRDNYSAPVRNRLPERDPGYSTLAEGMVIRGGGSRITIRRSFFADIATRGIIVSGGVDDLTVEHNIFIRVSDDTAGGDVAVGGGVTRMTVRENLMAGNVDGIVTDGAGAGHIFERNIIIFHRWEDGIDIKSTWKRKDEDPWTIVRNNVFYSRLSRYSAISIQFGTDYVKVLGNVFHGTGACETILIRGRNGSDGLVGNVENHEIVGNWFDFKPGYNDGGNAFRIHQYTADPSDISNVYILHNVFTGGHRLGGMTHGSNLNVYNNIFESTTFGGVSAPDVAAGTNLYHNTAVWAIDTDPIVGEPVYTDNPVGPLAEGSPGKGRATVIRGRYFGNDVGLPQSTENLVKLEISILQSLEEHFTYEQIKEAMGQGGVSYDDDGDRLFDLWEKYYFGRPAACGPNADPDNDGIANLEEYANGTDPLDPNSVPWKRKNR